MTSHFTKDICEWPKATGNRMFNPVVIREMQIKTTMKYHKNG